uniref:TNF receptor-associated factor 2-like n=1 Tax=Myxine glutinosa TaxID=7769 RepID=UPI00358EFF16
MKCDLLLKKAVQAHCGHRFCSACLLQLVRNGPTRCMKCAEENSIEEDISMLQQDGVDKNTGEHERISFVSHLGLVLDVLHKSSGVAPVLPEQLEARISSVERKLFVVEQLASSRAVAEPHLGASCREDSQVYRQRTTGVNVEEAPTTVEHPEGLRQRLELSEQSIRRFENIVTVLNREVKSLSVQTLPGDQVQHGNTGTIDFLNSKVVYRCINIYSQIRIFEQEVGVNGVALADLRKNVEAMESATFDGMFIWKITEVPRKRNDAISGRQVAHYSPAFFTSRYGFRLCMRIYLNGDGAGHGTHISLFFVVMKGDHDALLKWPFRQKVTLMLMDQNNREHIIDGFRPDITSPSFQRPVHELNLASGCPRFCSLVILDVSRNSYVRDDTIFIKCIVDTSDL